MNDALLAIYHVINSVSGRTVIFGEPITETADTIIAIALEDSDEHKSYLGHAEIAMDKNVTVSVFSSEYLNGYGIFLQVKSEINAQGKTANVVYQKEKASYYDKSLNKYVFTAQYKQLSN